VPDVKIDGFDSNRSTISFVGNDMFAICFGLPAGQPVAGGVGVGEVAFWITPLCGDVAAVWPSAFFANTRNLTVRPTSAATSV